MPEAPAAPTPSGDRIDRVRLSLVFLPLAAPISDTKVPAGRHQPLTEVAFLFTEIGTVDGSRGLGFSYAKRAGGPALYAHAKELAPQLLGEDPSDTGRVWEKLAAAGSSAGRSGLAAQAIAAVDIALWDAQGQAGRAAAREAARRVSGRGALLLGAGVHTAAGRGRQRAAGARVGRGRGHAAAHPAGSRRRTSSGCGCCASGSATARH